MKRIVKSIAIIALIALVVLQFFRPEKNDSGYASVADFEAETKVSSEVATLLKNNCYDCHSNQTQYPWYAEIAPISLWLDDHVKHGKGDFNVSEWATYSLKKKEHKLEELIEEVKEGEMPLPSYTWIHGDLTSEEKKLLLQWATLTHNDFRAALQATQ
ncbi:heme-binding domain-containing protein [Altibacter sp. HG106]|uniref:heme-binding domain-containing protein n=1 Tax=Altibacter sp. HG106 TaxID=3023937 RepID=UPI002350DF99|nr:heme-binding domain-containing protein [Altibacter sp. HG106]MDC7996270.1 heme-binding domain-containing protein [Altibacter sp. HG106]